MILFVFDISSYSVNIMQLTEITAVQPIIFIYKMQIS